MPDIVDAFGNPEGARADIKEVSEGFVTFTGEFWGGLATQKSDLRARIIVGKKGAGKTVYLRILQEFAAREASLYARQVDFSQELPTTDQIVKFYELFPDVKIISEKWKKLWSAAIFRSLVSHLLCDKKLKQYVSEDSFRELKENFKPLYRNFGKRLSPYSQVSEIINQFNTPHQISSYLNHYLWGELDAVVSEVLKDCPPICFYIDTIDDYFSHAPTYWLHCQKGLFYQVMSFLQHAELGGKLHIIISLRDIVLSSIFRTEHRTRFTNDPHIRVLSWNKEAIVYFLTEKIKRLDDKYFLSDFEKNGKTLNTWLNIKHIKNKSRNKDEVIEDYLLRHTRLLPRDIVILGNELCSKIEKRSQRISEDETSDMIRKAVAKSAQDFGSDQLSICATQITSSFKPKNAARQGYSHIYIENPVYARGVLEELKEILNSAQKDRISNAELEKLKFKAEEKWGNTSDLPSVLWQNGLIGYTEMKGDHRCKFFSTDLLGEFFLPKNKEEYVFHSCLIDTVGLSAIGDPVYNFD